MLQAKLQNSHGYWDRDGMLLQTRKTSPQTWSSHDVHSAWNFNRQARMTGIEVEYIANETGKEITRDRHKDRLGQHTARDTEYCKPGEEICFTEGKQIGDLHAVSVKWI